MTMRASLLLVSLTIAVAVAAAEPPPSDERQILALEEAWGRALEKEDRSTLERIVAADFTFIEPDGSIVDRSAYLADREHNPAQIHSFEISEMQVKILGDSALVSGLSTVDESIAGRRYNYQLRWKEMWVKNGNAWQVMAGQATPVNAAWNAPFARE
jgi:ketosteroid isomerase-like protein